MKKVLAILGIIGILILSGIFIKSKFYKPKTSSEKEKDITKELSFNERLKNGDIIFQTSLSGQSQAIQFATHSKYSHCGLIFHKDNDTTNWYVIEAVQPVKWTYLSDWISKGKNGKYVIKRVVGDQKLSAPTLLNVRNKALGFLNKNYDLTFEWTDDKIYCSELIWKAYKQGSGIEIGKLEKLENFDLTNKIVKSKMKERYGEKIPKDEIVISPDAIYKSSLLETVIEDR
jgi:uncharacterized protein YycO